jgi:S-adenosylmethionine-diacylgycerolhomoserine-N-methlytransferase
VFSYCLSMIDPGWRQAVDAALQDLQPGGLLAVVDFHDTRFAGFQRWMEINHVRMDGHLLPHLNGRCRPWRKPCGGLMAVCWRYFTLHRPQKRDA